jgi:glucose/mannose-6-phosphate isomerase
MSGGNGRDSARHLPDQLRDIAVAAAETEGLPDSEPITSVVVLGAGLARVAGDVVAGICSLRAAVPVVAAGASCPSWVDESTLAIVVAPNGSDPGAVAAAQSARTAGACVIGVAPDGELARLARQWKMPLVQIDADAGPAAGLGVSVVPVLVLLERLGLISGMTQTVLEAADQVAERLTRLDHDPLVAELAAVLPGRLALVTAAGDMGKHAARRWVQELDRVGGVAAVRRRLPADADDVATGVRLSEASANGSVLILLRHSAEPKGLDGGVAIARDQFAHVFEFVASGEGPFAQLLDLVLVGDAVAEAVAHQSHRQT